MSTTTATAEIRLEIGCEHDACDELAWPLLTQLGSGAYTEMAVLPLPNHVGEWRAGHRTARKRCNRATDRGYKAHSLTREKWEDDIYAINTSAGMRQGRTMAPAYRGFQKFSRLPKYACQRHAVRATGVWSPGHQLVAYLVMIRAGQLALVSQILGHYDYLRDEIMYPLFEHALEREIEADPEALVVYNRWDSGTDGLRFFKERLGFGPMDVVWLP